MFVSLRTKASFSGCLVLLSSIILKVDTRAWSFSNLLMAGSQATVGYADTVALGAQRGLEECKEQFAWERWNCPQNDFTHVFMSSKLPANREIAFIHAIINAGIVHTVTKNCSMGQLDNCRCDRKKVDHSGGSNSSSAKDSFRWGGCSDNVDFGFSLAKAFLDDREAGRDPRAEVNLHNNLVGRMAVRNTMVRKCKCHGISGSCTTQTCWMRIAEFRVVGNYLKNAYRKAVKRDSNTGRASNSLGRIRKGISERSPAIAGHTGLGRNVISTLSSGQADSGGDSQDGLSATRLAFVEDSPDYCTHNAAGSNGTLGRQCSKRKGPEVEVDEKRSCRRLCRQCGFKVERQRNQVTGPCNCRFKFCCQVQCDQCTTDQDTFTCAAV
ncbi:Protein Wnt-8b [Halotydeus destructor]|nr:Protein Wnt-8b [Halotydeus destructor]